MTGPDLSTVAGIVAVAEDDDVIAELLYGWCLDRAGDEADLVRLPSPAREVGVALWLVDACGGDGLVDAWEAHPALVRAAPAALAELGLDAAAALLAPVAGRPSATLLDDIEDELDAHLDDVAPAVVAFARRHVAALDG